MGDPTVQLVGGSAGLRSLIIAMKMTSMEIFDDLNGQQVGSFRMDDGFRA